VLGTHPLAAAHQGRKSHIFRIIEKREREKERERERDR
jgi:hypothetical protein